MTLTIERLTTGRKAGKKCVKATKKNRKAKRCDLAKAAGKLARKNRKAGANSVAFSGRVDKKALAAGRYRVTIVARDAAGNASAARTLTFTVVKK